MKAYEGVLLICCAVFLVVAINIGFSGRLMQEPAGVDDSVMSIIEDAEVESYIGHYLHSDSSAATETVDDNESSVQNSGEYTAKKSIQRYLNEADARTPMIASYVPRIKATEDELTDPDAYSAYQARQNESHVRVYASAALSKMGAYEERVRQAQLEGGYEQREIDKALERLEKLKEMKKEIQEKHPHWQQ